MKKLLFILISFCLLTGATWFDAQQQIIVLRRGAGGGVDTPSMSSATIAANGTTLTLAYNVALTQGSGYNDSDINLDCTVNGNDISLTYVSGNTTTSHVYTIGATIYQSAEETCNLDFNGDPDSLENTESEDLGAISDGTVTNSSTQEQPTCDDSTCVGFDVCQNLEGTGYDNSETWTESGGAVNEDNNLTPLRGSQDLAIVYDSGTAFTSVYFTSRASAYFHILYRRPVMPDTSEPFFRLRGSDTDRFLLYQYQTGELVFYHGTEFNYTTGQLAANTLYHIWGYYAAGGGANGVAWVEFTPATTYSPTGSGDNYAAINNGDSTGNVDELNFMESIGYAYRADQILARPTAIGTVCN